MKSICLFCHCILTLLIICTTPITALAANQPLANGDFSIGDPLPSDWSLGNKPDPNVHISSDTSVNHSAPASLRFDIVKGHATGAVQQPFKEIPTGEFIMSFWSRAEGPIKIIKYDMQVFTKDYKQIAWLTSEDNPDHHLPQDKEWKMISRPFEFPEGTAHVIFYFSIEGDAGSKWWVDDLTFAIKPAPYKVDHNDIFDRTVIRSSTPSRVVGEEKYTWGNAIMGGVEGTRGIVWNPKHPDDLYIRADCGGVWKLVRSNNITQQAVYGYRWKCITDSIPWKWQNLVTATSVALDPENRKRIYIAGSGSRWSDQHAILITNDGGVTWNRTDILGNDGKDINFTTDILHGGETFVVDVNDSKRLWFGTSNNGLYLSEDYAKSFKPVGAFPVKGRDMAGITFVTLDWQHGKSGVSTTLIYAGVAGNKDNNEGGIYRSNDAGKSWKRLDGPYDKVATPCRGRLTPNGTLYITFDSPGSVWKYSPAQNNWTDITPSKGKGRNFSGLNIHPRDPDTLITADISGSAVYWTSDAGNTWKTYQYEKGNKPGSTLILGFQAPWERGLDEAWGGMTGDVAFDPVRPENVLHVSFTGPQLGTGAGDKMMTFSLIGEGREQMTCGDVVSPTKGAPLISGVWDVGGFRHEKLDTIPSHIIPLKTRDGHGNWGEKVWQDCFQIDINPAIPDRLVSAGGWQWNGTGDACYSMDNARTWIEFPAKPFPDAKFGRISMGTDPNNVCWVPMGDKQSPVYVTHDNGKTWLISQGSPLGLIATDGPWSFYKLIAADRIRKNTFYIYDRRDGRFYRSDDGGDHWKHVSRLPNQIGAHWDNNRVFANPYKSGDVWVSIQEHGLFHSDDAGKSWTKIDHVHWVVNFNFGRSRPGTKTPSLFVFGQIAGKKPSKDYEVNAALYRSDDNAHTFVRVNDPLHQLATICSGMCGDMQTWGRVYVATGSRGIFYAEPANGKK